VGTTYHDNDYSQEDLAIARLNPDGTPDPTFGAQGRVTTDFPGLAAVASSAVVQPDGKIVVAGGAFPLFTFLGNIEIVRYNPDGSLDTSFGSDGIVTTVFPHGSYAFAVALQPDGKIVAAGFQATSTQASVQFAVARYVGDPVAWLDQGGSLAGTAGAPLLVGVGSLVAGDAAAFHLGWANPSAPAVLFLSSSSRPAPFKGGLLLPFPPILQLVTATGAAGMIDLAFSVPSGLPSGLPIWLQWAFQDPGAVKGVSLSNALLGVTPW
jgi:uncharacterized delta-60 repeat protein